ncbi:MAG: type VI secretion system ATPase TssH, partial [Lachnospiraceae bacterium]|nr:type VI secretion system ATPase TssH [Candidatus Hippenecus merdae]
MNINKFTQKSMEAVNGCEKVASDHGNKQIEQEHLLFSLLTIEDSLIEKLFKKMGVDTDAFAGELEEAINTLPKVSGDSAQMYFSNDCNRVLTEAE